MVPRRRDAVWFGIERCGAHDTGGNPSGLLRAAFLLAWHALRLVERSLVFGAISATARSQGSPAGWKVAPDPAETTSLFRGS